MIAWDYDNPLALAEGESPKANQALNDYALLGPSRSLSQLAEQYQGRTKGVPTKQHSKLKEWSAAYSWQQRVTTYDEQQRHKEREAAEQATIASRIAYTKRLNSLAERFYGRVEEMFAFPLAEVERVERRHADGTPILTTIIKPTRWGLRDAAGIAEVAAKLNAMALDVQTHAAGLDALSELTEEQLAEMPLSELLELREKVARGEKPRRRGL